jgi:hypothetical protein
MSAPVYSSNWNAVGTPNFCYSQTFQNMSVLESYDNFILLWKSFARWILVSGHKRQRKRLPRHAAMSAWCNLHEETLTSLARCDPLVNRAKELSHPFYWKLLDARDCDPSD